MSKMRTHNVCVVKSDANLADSLDWPVLASDISDL